ncbi:aromatic amino acid transaminase [Terricaulis sp.]|uniref:aromatic amino acid transaminase n=1 Tax=Terricaulis sp. TaxID=2768686 RepID=UPI00378505BA
MLNDLAVKPPDPLLKIIKMFREDPRTDKIDLGVGVFRDDNGATPVMKAVKEAERRLVAEQPTKTYVGQQGDVEFQRLIGELTFGEQGRDFVSIQAVGGTGALRLGCDLLRDSGARRVLLPTPSWPNHPAIIRAARLEVVGAPFFDVATQQIDIDALIAGFAKAEKGDSIILQGCCHNPLGADFSRQQWEKLADGVMKHGLIPFIDLAYQGFGDGLEQDVEGARLFLSRVPHAIIALSGAKNFGLYRERVGALFVKAPAQTRAAVQSNLFAIARANYSMPPDHGASCVRLVLSDPALKQMWIEELDAIRGQMKKTRAALAAARINSIPMSRIGAQRGMFSTLPLEEAQIVRLREEFGVYMTDLARINIAGLPERDMERFLTALRAVTS